MKNINPLLLLDFYKVCHQKQYPKNISKIVSYYTPRTSRIDGLDYIVHFGLQGYIKEYLIDMFNDNFFNKDIEEIMAEYKEFFDNHLSIGVIEYDRIRELHKLGYLPIKISSLPEGTKVPIGVPMFEITNTHPDFAWLVNTLETQISATLWHAQVSATIGRLYRDIVNKYYDMTVDDSMPAYKALGDFSMRGQESVESATKSSAGFLLSFTNTATVPAIIYLKKYYEGRKDNTGFGAISTEHSTVTSNFIVDGDEETMFLRLLTETYPTKNFSYVADSYDYWNFIDNILPKHVKKIRQRYNTTFIRGDSGDPVEVVTKTVYKLWDIFGGYTNNKGYKVLDNTIRVIYGDSITLKRAEEIYDLLAKEGFASNNVVLGVGSFSMQCMEDINGILQPFTRDTFGVAIKSTYCEVEGKPIMIFKSPKEDSTKKSHTGLCSVLNMEGKLECIDKLLDHHPDNLLQEVFVDGKITKEITLQEIRQNLRG